MDPRCDPDSGAFGGQRGEGEEKLEANSDMRHAKKPVLLSIVVVFLGFWILIIVYEIIPI